jgi:hypothetical protein
VELSLGSLVGLGNMDHCLSIEHITNRAMQLRKSLRASDAHAHAHAHFRGTFPLRD